MQFCYLFYLIEYQIVIIRHFNLIFFFFFFIIIEVYAS